MPGFVRQSGHLYLFAVVSDAFHVSISLKECVEQKAGREHAQGHDDNKDGDQPQGQWG